MNLIERLLINLIYITNNPAKLQGIERIIEKIMFLIELNLKLFKWENLCEASMNYRNTLFQHLFKVSGKLNELVPDLDLELKIIEFLNEEM